MKMNILRQGRGGLIHLRALFGAPSRHPRLTAMTIKADQQGMSTTGIESSPVSNWRCHCSFLGYLQAF